MLKASLVRRATVIFLIAVGINYVWEVGQVPFYSGLTFDGPTFWHCFIASLGDGLILLAIFGVGWAAQRRQDWFERPGANGYALMLGAGLLIAIAIEWFAVHMLQRWRYSELMPELFGVGLVPIAQMLLLPLLIFRLSAIWLRSTTK